MASDWSDLEETFEPYPGGIGSQRLCGAERLMWNAQLVLDDLNYCWQPGDMGMGWFLKLRRHLISDSRMGVTGASELQFEIEKVGWSEAAFGGDACSSWNKYGPSPANLNTFVTREFGDTHHDGAGVLVSAADLNAFVLRWIFKLTSWKQWDSSWQTAARKERGVYEFPPPRCTHVTPSCPAVMRSALSYAQGAGVHLLSVDSITDDSRGPASASRPPRIYVYELPSELSTSYVLAPRRGRGEAFTRLEEELHHAMLTSPLRTMDPLEADLFYVPLYSVSACTHLKSDCKDWNSAPHCIGCRVAEPMVDKVMEYVARQGFFKVGADAKLDHIVSQVYDYGRCLTTKSQTARKHGFSPAMGNTISVGPLGSNYRQECYIPRNDVVIAPFVSDQVARVLEERAVRRQSPDSSHVALFVYFRGDLNQGPDGEFRRRMYSVVSADKDGGGNGNVRSLFASIKVPLEQHLRDIGRATFCLCPPGFSTWSYRLVESILGGCIPVLYQRPGEVQPFEGLGMLDYSKFAVVIRPEDVEETLPKLRFIANQSPATLTAMREELAKVSPLFSYQRCGLDMVMEGMARRWNDIQLRRRDDRLDSSNLTDDAAVHTPRSTEITVARTERSSKLAAADDPHGGALFDVDVVFTWANGSNPSFADARASAWRALWSKGDNHSVAGDAMGSHRVADHDELRFALRSVYANAPWVRKIFVVAGKGQVPSYLSDYLQLAPQQRGDGPEVVVVSHEDIFPHDATDLGMLPSFNSNSIETVLYRIQGLAEHWVLMNDDFFFGRPVSKLDLFTADGKPRVWFQYQWGKISSKPPTGALGEMGYMWATYNLNQLLNAKFGADKTRYRIMHQAVPMTVSLHRQAHEYFPNAIDRTMGNPFRSKDDVLSYFLALWIGIYEGTAVRVPQSETISNMYVNIINNNEVNKRVLSKVLSPCMPSVVHEACLRKDGASAVSCPHDSGSNRDLVVYDPGRGICRPIHKADPFATLTTLRECAEQCIHRGAPLDGPHPEHPWQSPYSLLCINDMTRSPDADTQAEIVATMRSFFCTTFPVVPPWEAAPDGACRDTRDFFATQG